MLPISNAEENALIWKEITATELNAVLAGRTITGAEPIDPAGFLLYLEGDTGSASVLEVTGGVVSGEIFATIAQRKENAIVREKSKG